MLNFSKNEQPELAKKDVSQKFVCGIFEFMLNFQLLQRSDLREHSLFICFKKGWYTADRFCKLDRHISTRIKPFMSVKLWLL